MICGVMMKTTMPVATGTVELAAAMKAKDGMTTAITAHVLTLHFQQPLRQPPRHQ
jgi:hypothetical protein